MIWRSSLPGYHCVGQNGWEISALRVGYCQCRSRANNYLSSRVRNTIWCHGWNLGRRLLRSVQSPSATTQPNPPAGTGYIEGFDTSTDSITFTINSTTSQLYDLSIIYNGPYGDKYTYIVLNNAGGSQVSLPATTAWTTVPAGQVLLAAGSNSIQIQNNWGWYLIDAIALSPSAPRAPHRITPTPVTPNANSDASALLAYLASVYGSHILAGQQDPASLAWVTQNIGKTPAVLGVDFMDYTASRTSRGAVSSDVDSALAFAQQGGIVTFCWHWGAPAGLYDTPEHPWYSGFYTDATDFDVAAALADPAGANYTLLMQDIDAIAAQLKKLQSAGVPVIWRPLHEAEGGWFWWGARGPEPAKQLWRVLYERLTNVHGLRNLVWEWNSVAPEWYPGDDVVDLVSADTYAQGDHGVSSHSYLPTYLPSYIPQHVRERECPIC